jgi:hypothetical protein
LRVGERERKRKEKEKIKRWWDMCPTVGGWEEIMLSPPSQPRVGTWLWKITFYFKAQTFINYIKTPLY